jgi:hypothetical protein
MASEITLELDDGSALDALAGGRAPVPLVQWFFDTDAFALDDAGCRAWAGERGGAAVIGFDGARGSVEWAVSTDEARDLLEGRRDPVDWLAERVDLNDDHRALAAELATARGDGALSVVGRLAREVTELGALRLERAELGDDLVALAVLADPSARDAVKDITTKESPGAAERFIRGLRS